VKTSVSASSVAVVSGEVFTKSPPPLPQAVRRFFASRTTIEPHPEALKIVAQFPDIAASVLTEANCSLPLSFTCTVNDKGSVSLLGSDLHTSASAYTPYFAPLSSRLNKAFPVGNSPWDLFKPAPNETQILIHSIPFGFLPQAMPNSSHLFMSPSGMPGESPFSQRVTLTRTQNLGIKSQQPQWLSLWPHLTLSPSSPPSTSSPET